MSANRGWNIQCLFPSVGHCTTSKSVPTIKAGRKPIGPTGPIAPNWAPRLRRPRSSAIYSRLVKYIQVQTLVQVDWEPGPTEIVPNWAPRLRRLRSSVIYSRLVKYIQVQTLVQVDWEPGPTEIVPPHLLRSSLSAIIGRGRFGTVPFTLPLVPGCLYGIRAVFKCQFIGESLLKFFYFTVETLNYANIMSRID